MEQVVIKVNGEAFKIFKRDGEDDYEFFDVHGDRRERGSREDVMELLNEVLAKNFFEKN